MAEKVLHEVRVVETEDGYRIEIKGDKERIKEFLQHRGPGRGFGPMGPIGFMHRRHRHHGHHGFPFGRFWGGPWGWDEEEDEEEAPRRGREADRGSDDPRV